jgi:hypothetical protein
MNSNQSSGGQELCPSGADYPTEHFSIQVSPPHPQRHHTERQIAAHTLAEGMFQSMSFDQQMVGNSPDNVSMPLYLDSTFTRTVNELQGQQSWMHLLAADSVFIQRGFQAGTTAEMPLYRHAEAHQSVTSLFIVPIADV